MSTNEPTTTTDDQPAARKPRPIKPNYFGQPEGRAAVETQTCPTCKAGKGGKCANAAGEPSAYVHPARYAKWQKAGEPPRPDKAPAEKPAKAPAKKAPKAAAKKAPAKGARARRHLASVEEAAAEAVAAAAEEAAV